MVGQRGVSVLAVLLSIVIVGGGALLAISWYTDYRALARAQKAEEDAARGTVTAPSPGPAKAAESARERADKVQSAETAVDFRGLVDPASYRALTPECQRIVDTIVGLLDKPEDSAAFRKTLAESEALFSANCVDRAAEATASAATDARNALETKQIMCKQQRDAAAEFSSAIAMTLNDGPEKPGVIDEDKKVRRASLDENRKRLQEIETYIAANC